MINRQLRPDQHRIGRVPVPGVPLTAENTVIENPAGDEILAFFRNRCVGFKPGKHILEAELVPPRLHIPARFSRFFMYQTPLLYIQGRVIKIDADEFFKLYHSNLYCVKHN